MEEFRIVRFVKLEYAVNTDTKTNIRFVIYRGEVEKNKLTFGMFPPDSCINCVFKDFLVLLLFSPVFFIKTTMSMFCWSTHSEDTGEQESIKVSILDLVTIVRY
jgi:hypothetical protein